MTNESAISLQLDRIMHEIAQLKKEFLAKRKGRVAIDRAWEDLLSLSDEITKLWSGPGAVEEIRMQRERP